MNNLRSLPLFVLASALLCSAAALAQQAAPAVRIVSPIDESQLVTLAGHVNPKAFAASDIGPVSADLPMAGLVLVLSRSADRQAAFDAFVASQYDHGSPNFHQWLTPSQIGAQFGPAQADVATLTGWLTSHGFAVKSISPDGMSIQFSGTAGQVESAFHTGIHNISVNGKAHIANIADAQIPAALAPLVVGVKGLHNFLPRPLHRVGSRVQLNPNAHGWVRLQTSPGAGAAAGALRPQAPAVSANSASSSKPNFYYPISGTTAVVEDLAPYDFAKIYNLPATWPSTTNGSGQIISVIGTSDIDLSDVVNFKSAFGLPAGLTPVIAHGPDGDPGNCGANPSNFCNDGDLEENSLDVEWSGAVAPGAQIVLVTDALNAQPEPTNDPIYEGAQWAIDNAYVAGTPVYGSRILSISYGECELFNGTATNVAYNNMWETAYAAGIAVFLATGDSGSATCDQGGDSIGYPYEAQYGLSVSGLASSPYDTAVGGTDFSWCRPSYTSNGTFQGCTSSNASTYWNTSNNSQEASAKGYVPETPWNDNCTNPIWTAYFQSIAPLFDFPTPANPEAACNFIYNDWQQVNLDNENAGGGQFVIAPWVDVAGGSGGASSCVVNSTTLDIGSCNSSATSTGSSYGNLPLNNDGWPKPSWQSGITGIPSDGVRDMPDVSLFAGDGALLSATLVCVSNDGASCTNLSETGSGNTGGAEEFGGTSISVQQMAGVMALINQKAGAAQGNPNAELYALAARQTYSSCSAESPPGSGCYFNSIDEGTNAMPCDYEGKALEGGAVYDGATGMWESSAPSSGLASPNCSIVNAGDVVGVLSGYGAATGFNQATGLGSPNIANVVNASGAWTAVAGTTSATVTFTAPASGASISENQSLNVTITVSGSSGMPAGEVSLTATNANEYSTAAILSGGTASFTIPANTFTSTGTATLTAAYSGDSTYASHSNTSNITVTSSTTPAATFTLNPISSPSAISPGSPASTSASVSSTSGYAGIVTLNCNLTNSPSGAINLPNCSPKGTITLSAAVTSGSTQLSVTTTPVTTSELVKPAGSNGLLGAGGGAVLALLVFFGIPARRRSWRSMLGILVAMVGLGVLASCGGGGSGASTTIPGTTAGTYTFTVTATGNPSISATQTQTFTLTVN